ncbi:hypothetical protein [Paenibacillus protaetiae]|uniref:Cyclic nucleotide-binding domain-containing protein n=1 Tax=Paenibacillus protaetiae TaxID=2509456 RepID=A0A4P6F1S6_9BACL|nr:hypothetical protein [Paenibacillus protaetiae]QAY67007.1 hypothetical protein ET464_11990 [Paenibacillus protaetiae]
MLLQEQLSLWNDMAIKLLDVQRKRIPAGQYFRHEGLASNMLFLVSSGHGKLFIDGDVYPVKSFFVCHAGRGAGSSLRR